MGVISALAPSIEKEAVLLADKLGISLEEAIAKLTTKSTPTLEKDFATTVPGTLSGTVRGKGFSMREPDISPNKSLSPVYKAPQYEEKGLVPKGKGFTHKDSPNMDAEWSDTPTPPAAPKQLSAGRPAMSRPMESAGENYEDSLPNYTPETPKGVSTKQKLGLGAGAAALAGAGYAASRYGNSSRPESSTSGIGPVSDNDTYGQMLGSLPQEYHDTLKTPPSEPTSRGPAEATDIAPKKPASLKEAVGSTAENKKDAKEAIIQIPDNSPLKQQALDLYNRAQTRNEWSEVAQTLARAVAQFGAAQGQGGKRDMSNLPMGPGIDYEARSARAQRDYEHSIGDINATSDRDIKKQMMQQEADRYQTGLEKQARQEALQNKQYDLNSRKADISEANLNKRAEQAEVNLASRENTAALNAEGKTLAGQEQEAGKQQRAAQQLQSLLADKENLSKQGWERLQPTLIKLSGESGVSMDEIEQAKKAGTTHSIFGIKAPDWMPFSAGQDPSKTSAALQQSSVEPISAGRRDLQSRIEQLNARRAGRSAPAQTLTPSTGKTDSAGSSGASVVPSGKVRVNRGDETLEIPAEHLAAAIKDGYKQVQ